MLSLPQIHDMQPITYERDQLDLQAAFSTAAHVRRLIFSPEFKYRKDTAITHIEGKLEGMEEVFYCLGIMEDYFQYLKEH